MKNCCIQLLLYLRECAAVSHGCCCGKERRVREERRRARCVETMQPKSAAGEKYALY